MQYRSRTFLATFLTLLMLTNISSAAVTSWSGPSSLNGSSKTVSDAFQVPGNATVVDAWLNVDETGALSDGTGQTWTGEDVPGNFSVGMFSDSMMGKFTDSLSLAPDSAVSNVDTFASASLQLAGHWTTSGSMWGVVNPSGMGGTIMGANQAMSYGIVPAAAVDGGVVAATLPGSALPASSSGTLATPAVPLPSPISDFNLTFSHWYHFSSSTSGGGDGGWVEYKLDNGAWNWMAPAGGYPSNASANITTPNGASGSGFGVFADANYSGWMTSTFNLDNLTGLSNASTITFRFKAATDNGGKPGWFIDDIDLTNVGSPAGNWHHGCITQAPATCGYSNNADAVLTSPTIDLSSATSTVAMNFEVEWDLEGSSYDNLWAEASTDGIFWDDITSSALTYSSTFGASGIPASGFTYNGNSYTDDSGGWVSMSFDLPASYQGDSTTWVRFRVQTDSSVQYGASPDDREGATFDNLTLTDSSGTTYYSNTFSNATSMTPAANGGVNDWQYPGAGTLFITDSFEDSSALPPGGWAISNVAGQDGWQFGSLCSNFTGGPTTFVSPNLGFGTNLCGNYDGSSENHLYTPTYSIPLVASARFTWQHWMCAEGSYDGGALFMKVNNGAWNQVTYSYANGTSWYDDTITSGGTQSLFGSEVWNGIQHSGTGFSCTASSVPWVKMDYDVSNWSGSNVSFRFTMSSDSIVEMGGWYIDDAGLEVDWFHDEGSWRSPLTSVHDLGYGFIDADITLPNGTWYGVTLLDSTGNPIAGHENRSLPLSLTTLDRDLYPSVYIELSMGTTDFYYSPIIKELTIGATRYLGDGNGWNIPSNLQRNANGTWVYSGGVTAQLSAETGITSRPVSSAEVTGNFTQATVGLLNMNGNFATTQTTGSVLNLGGMQGRVSPIITLSPGATIDSLAFRGEFVQPAHDATIDVADDGVDDWEFVSDVAYGSYGWQTRIYSSSIIHSDAHIGTSTMQTLIPEDAMPHTLVIGLNSTAPSGQLSILNDGNLLSSTSQQNWTIHSACIQLNNLVATSTISDGTRNWSVIEFDFTTTSLTQYTMGSFAIGYTLAENVSGLGSVVKAYHEANSNNGLEVTVDVPVSWTAQAGGVGIGGGIYHENMITNHPFTVPETWYPNGLIQGFTTQHHHLLDNDDITEVHLIGTDSTGDKVQVVLTDLSTGGTFVQTSGEAMLKLLNTTTLSETNGRWVIDWQFDVDWDWNDSAEMVWTAQGFDVNGDGLSPASALSGGIGTQASENDLQVDTWSVEDDSSHLLSDMFNPAYPFWAMAGSDVIVSGTVRFENTLDMRPQQDDFVIAVDVEGDSHIMMNTGSGTWSGIVTLPNNMSNANLTPYVLRVGPIEGADGADDVTLQSPVLIRLDDESPWVSELQVNTGQRLQEADGYTWDPASPLGLQVTITDNQALGSELTLHYWREGADDSNGDGIADPLEYQTSSESLPDGIAGERTKSFSGIDVSGLEMNAQFSVWFSSTDFSGHSLQMGGAPGVDSDMATLIIATNEPTEIDPVSLELDTAAEHLLAGQLHTLSFEVSDANGVNSIDQIDIQLLGTDEEINGVLIWEPRNGAMYTPEGSQLTLHDVNVTELTDSFRVEFTFSLDWTFDETLIENWAMPTIRVWDDDPFNPVKLMTNLGEIRWKLDNNLEAVVDEMTDNTPPLSSPSDTLINVKSGDDLTFSGSVRYSASQAPVSILPESGLSVEVSTIYGSELVSALANISSDGTWSTEMLLPSRPLLPPELTVEYSVVGVISPGEDATTVVTGIIVDDIVPAVTYTAVPLVITDEDLEVLPFTIAIDDQGGLPEGDLVVHWAFIRNGVVLEGGQSSGIIPYIATNEGVHSYSGTADFTQGVNISLADGDSLIWWINVVDLAGNTAVGTGTSQIDPMRPSFTVLSFDITITSIDITLENGTIPRGNQVVEGDIISVTIIVKNLGTKAGVVQISLMEDLQRDRDWLLHDTVELSIGPGQSLNSQAITFETHGSGSQYLYLNVSGQDRWIDNVIVPHCSGHLDKASCTLDLDPDMPNVITAEEANSGIGTMTLVIVILALLLVGMAVAIVVIMKRSPDQSSMYYDDDDWDQFEDEDEEEIVENLENTVIEKVAPILPPMAPPRPEILDEPIESVPDVAEIDEPEEEIVEVSEDPWGDVDYDETETPEVDEPEEIEVEDFSSYNVKTLKEKAKAAGVKKYTSMKKAELVAALSGNSDTEEE
ncbi:MAG: hypothetical protein QGG96_05945 [Candidatus Poseidoniaceae archaeon]|nr:hypothetical protein [Candidatus Poseidoniaceae archaeon]